MRQATSRCRQSRGPHLYWIVASWSRMVRERSPWWVVPVQVGWLRIRMEWWLKSSLITSGRSATRWMAWDCCA
jgi:hypothetical protein